MEDNLKKIKNGRRPKKIKWKTYQSTKINLIGCDTIVNSHSTNNCLNYTRRVLNYTDVKHALHVGIN